MISSADAGQQGSEATFQVVLNGLHSQMLQSEARAKLATLFKATHAQIERILAKPGYVVKKGITFETASKYRTAIESAGGVCELVQERTEVASIEVDLPQEELPTAKLAQLPIVERILFQGDASLIRSLLSMTQGNALGTAERFVFSGDKKGDITLKRTDIKSVEEAKHGFAKKWVVTTTTGQRYQFVATNAGALKVAMLTLAGQDVPPGTYKEPLLSEVKNGTAWLAAFGPILSGILLLIVGALMNWSLQSTSSLELFKMWLFKLAMIYMFLRIDSANLQWQGYNTVKLGIVAPEDPRYLFSRAKAFGHGKGYAVTWCVLFSVELLALIFA